MTLIRLGGCQSWSESSLDAHTFCWFFSGHGSVTFSLDSLHTGLFLLLSTDKLFQKNLSGTLSECQIIWIQIMINILSVLIWVQAVCKVDLPMTKIAASKDRINKQISRLQQATILVISILIGDSLCDLITSSRFACIVEHHLVSKEARKYDVFLVAL